MNKKLSLLLYFVLIAGLLSFGACGDDDDDDNNGGGTNPPTVNAWEGTWLSAGDDVAPILVNYSGLDSVFVEFTNESLVTLQTHSEADGWVTLTGTYSVTESSNSDIDAIETSYTGAYDQEGIIQVFDASPDSMWLEVVPTTLGVPIPAVSGGFGVWGYGDTNIQVYRRVSN